MSCSQIHMPVSESRTNLARIRIRLCCSEKKLGQCFLQAAYEPGSETDRNWSRYLQIYIMYPSEGIQGFHGRSLGNEE